MSARRAFFSLFTLHPSPFTAFFTLHSSLFTLHSHWLSSPIPHLHRIEFGTHFGCGRELAAAPLNQRRGFLRQLDIGFVATERGILKAHAHVSAFGHGTWNQRLRVDAQARDHPA